jgi:hypothetical protein
VLVVVDFQDYGFYGGVAGDEDSWGVVSWGWGCGGRRIGGMGKIGKGEETGWMSGERWEGWLYLWLLWSLFEVGIVEELGQMGEVLVLGGVNCRG